MKRLLDRLFRGKLTYKNITAVYTIIILIGCAIGLIMIVVQESRFAGPIGFPVMIVFIIVAYRLNWVYWRCPHCEQSFPWRVPKRQMPYCPSCGERINWK
jgi:NAD-dependent protein deacetylases, SIR2 family